MSRHAYLRDEEGFVVLQTCDHPFQKFHRRPPVIPHVRWSIGSDPLPSEKSKNVRSNICDIRLRIDDEQGRYFGSITRKEANEPINQVLPGSLIRLELFSLENKRKETVTLPLDQPTIENLFRKIYAHVKDRYEYRVFCGLEQMGKKEWRVMMTDTISMM